MNINEFLNARIAEDEAQAKAAEAATSKHWEHASSILFQLDSNKPPNADPLAIVEHHTQNDALPHIARHDPARVLSECAAKRVILNHYPATEEWVTDQAHCDPEPRQHRASWNIPIALYAIAQPYADHPDFKPEWKLQ